MCNVGGPDWPRTPPIDSRNNTQRRSGPKNLQTHTTSYKLILDTTFDYNNTMANLMPLEQLRKKPDKFQWQYITKRVCKQGLKTTWEELKNNPEEFERLIECPDSRKHFLEVMSRKPILTSHLRDCLSVCRAGQQASTD